MHQVHESALLSRIGERILARRKALRWSRDALALRARVSLRFLSDVEHGAANISVLRLEQLARALKLSLAALVAEPEASQIIALVGLRGAGKSTVGKLLSERLALPFVELDKLVEEQSGLTLEELFALHGEEYFREWEARALKELLASGSACVLATGGGIVGSEATYELLLARTVTVWLRATADAHWSRVVNQGDFRPLRDESVARLGLEQRLRTREPAYGRARLTVDTSAQAPEQVVERIVEGLSPAASREGR